MKFISELIFLCCVSCLTFVVTQTSLGSGNISPTSQGQKRQRDSIRSKFEQWKSLNNKSYGTKEDEEKAKKNFEKNENSIESHNKRSNETFKRGASDHSDLSYEEKKVMRMGISKPSLRRPTRSLQSRIKRDSEAPKDNSVLPTTVDYRDKMTAIKNQADCGACWAFSAVAVLEFQIKLFRNISIQLSEQELIDCNNDGMSCIGGWPSDAYYYVKNNGLGSNENYEFLAYSNDCLNDRMKRVTKITDYCELDMGGDEEAIKWLVANYGSVVVTIWATDAFTSYKSGVYYEKNCPSIESNHAVVIVGYGTDPQFGDFWWIRNSWGTSWGIEGYGKYARNKNNTCGICNVAMLPCNTDV